MKTLFTCLAFFFAIAAGFAQSRFALAPTYVGVYGREEFRLSRNSEEVMRFNTTSRGSSFGITTYYTFHPQWRVSIGLLYAYLADDVQYTYAQTYRAISQRQTNSYVQLPVQIGYRLSQSRLAPYISAGMLFSNESMTANRVGIKTSALIGAGIDYQINSRWSLLIQPTGSYRLNRPIETNSDQFGPYRSYQLGIQTQLIWHL